MKKSVIYELAQIAVVENENFDSEIKLEVLRELMQKEDLAIFVEKQEAKEKTDG